MNRTLAAFIAGALFATLIAWLFSGRNEDRRETAPAEAPRKPRVYHPIAPPPRKPSPPSVSQPQYGPYGYGTHPNPDISGYRFRPLDEDKAKAGHPQPPAQPYPYYPPASPRVPAPMYDYYPPTTAPAPTHRDRERRWIGNY